MVDYKELDELCRQNIEDYDEKVSMAWGYMDRMRCPLRKADGELFDEMTDTICEWCEVNGYSVDFFEDWQAIIEGDEGILWEC